MKKHLTSRLRAILCAALILCAATHSYASHIFGADLRYVWVSDSTYKIVISLYGDCSSMGGVYPTLAVATPQVCIFDGATSVSSVFLTLDTPLCGREITPLCPGDTSTCTALTYTIPGINKFVYSGIYTLPHASATWRFIYAGNNGTTSAAYSCTGSAIGSGTAAPAAAGRSSAITNMVPGTTIQLIDTLNDLTSHNSSVDLTVAQQTIFCNNQHDEYNPGAVDPDGDSLYISLVTPTLGSGACGTVGSAAAYTGNAWPGMPIVANEPLQVVVDSFAINNATGKLTFVPNVFQRSVVVYNIDEYRAGVKVGSSQREMTVLVVECAGAFPCLSTTSLDVQKNAVNDKIGLFPNPAYDELTIKVAGNNYTSFTITNTLGQVLLDQPIAGSQTDVDIHSLTPGLYYISLHGASGTETRNFVKK